MTRFRVWQAKATLRLRKAWRWFVGPPFQQGHLIDAPEYGIWDGVDYTQPVIVPFLVKQQGASAVQAVVMEATQKQTMRFQFDAPYRNAAYDGPVAMPTEDPLEEWDFVTRKSVLTNCHAAYQRNPLAKQAVNITRQFAVGKGASLTYHHKEVEAVIEAFITDPENAFDEYQKTLLQDLQVDGELFIRKVTNTDGSCVVVPIRPWFITEIETEPGFLRRVTRYHLEYTTDTQSRTQVGGQRVDEWIPADEMLHVAINRHSYELRGRPDLFVMLPWLRAYKEWLENRARQNKWRNSLLYDVSIEGASPGVVANAAARYRKPPPDGSIVVHSSKETWDVKTNPVGAGDVAEDGRQLKLMAAVGMGLPEYMLSDGENANLASATAQELPALWRFVDAQQMMVEQVWTPLLRWVVETAVNNGTVPAEVPMQDSDGDPIQDANDKTQMVEAVKAFEISYPQLDEDDPKTLAEALAIATMNDWVSNETASGQMGFEWQKERKRIAREKEERRDEMAQGLAMMPPPAGEQPNGQAPGEQQQDMRQNGQPVAA